MGVHNFIIQTKNEYNETFKTESGLELYADKDFSQDRLVNRFAVVKALPTVLETKIQVGDEVMVDPTVFYRQKYEKTGLGDNHYIVDEEHRLYQIPSSLIIAYKRNGKWNGNEQNLLIKVIKKDTQEKKGDLYIGEEKDKDKLIEAKLFIGNEFTEDEGITKDDTLVLSSRGIPFYIDGAEYDMVRNKEILAVKQ